MALASVAVLIPRQSAPNAAPRPLRSVAPGTPDARLGDARRRREVLELFVEAAAFGHARSPGRKARLDADDRAYERDRTGHGTFQGVDDDGAPLGVAGRVIMSRTSQTKTSKMGSEH
jgi:hypothetical protein